VLPRGAAAGKGSGMKDSEWYGEPHTLTVHAAHAPHGPLDDGCLDYELEHPQSCKESDSALYGAMVREYTCDVAHQEQESGLASSLRYSGTPITEPGTYRIQSWGRKTYYYGAGYEYDGGVGVMGPESTA